MHHNYNSRKVALIIMLAWNTHSTLMETRKLRNIRSGFVSKSSIKIYPFNLFLQLLKHCKNIQSDKKSRSTRYQTFHKFVVNIMNHNEQHCVKTRSFSALKNAQDSTEPRSYLWWKVITISQIVRFIPYTKQFVTIIILLK